MMEGLVSKENIDHLKFLSILIDRDGCNWRMFLNSNNILFKYINGKWIGKRAIDRKAL